MAAVSMMTLLVILALLAATGAVSVHAATGLRKRASRAAGAGGDSGAAHAPAEAGPSKGREASGEGGGPSPGSSGVTDRHLSNALVALVALLVALAALGLVIFSPVDTDVNIAPKSKPSDVKREANEDDGGECAMPVDLVGAYGTGVMPWVSGLPASTNEHAQALFEQGLLQRFGFNLPEAQRNCEAALEEDDTCALCAWCVAYGTGPSLNEGISLNLLRKARTMSARALKLARTDVELAYAKAIAARYLRPDEAQARDPDAVVTPREPPSGSSAGAVVASYLREGAWVESLRSLAKAFSADATAQSLYGESLLQNVSWRYYQDTTNPSALTFDVGVVPPLRPEAQLAREQVSRALSLDSQHPLALHLYIHVEEQLPQGGPEGGTVAAADAMESVAPHQAHLVHMASHIYIRSGKYMRAIEANEEAMKLDAQMRAQCMVPYAPGHQIAVLIAAGMLMGRPAVIEQGTPTVAIDFPLAEIIQAEWPYPRVLVAARFGMWDVIRAEPLPGADAHPYARVIGHYAAGLAATDGKRDESALEEAASHLAEVERAASELPADGPMMEGTEYEGALLRSGPFFSHAPELAKIASITLRARLHIARSDLRRKEREQQALTAATDARAAKANGNYGAHGTPGQNTDGTRRLLLRRGLLAAPLTAAREDGEGSYESEAGNDHVGATSSESTSHTASAYAAAVSAAVYKKVAQKLPGFNSTAWGEVVPLLEEAVDIQDAFGYMEPERWVRSGCSFSMCCRCRALPRHMLEIVPVERSSGVASMCWLTDISRRMNASIHAVATAASRTVPPDATLPRDRAAHVCRLCEGCAHLSQGALRSPTLACGDHRAEPGVAPRFSVRASRA